MKIRVLKKFSIILIATFFLFTENIFADYICKTSVIVYDYGSNCDKALENAEKKCNRMGGVVTFVGLCNEEKDENGNQIYRQDVRCGFNCCKMSGRQCLSDTECCSGKCTGYKCN